MVIFIYYFSNSLISSIVFIFQSLGAVHSYSLPLSLHPINLSLLTSDYYGDFIMGPILQALTGSSLFTLIASLIGIVSTLVFYLLSRIIVKNRRLL